MATTLNAIFGGHDDTPETPGNDDVVALRVPTPGFPNCSGFLLTLVIGVTAAHCDMKVGNLVFVGLNTPGYPGGGPSRAQRTIVDVVNFISPSIAEKKGDLDVIAQDVALFRFWPPITSGASPHKPSLQTPALNAEGFPVPVAEFAGGMCGYGEYFDPNTLQFVHLEHRQVYISSHLIVSRWSVGGGLAVWAYGGSDAHQGTLPGDSGGPLFALRTPSDHNTRDVIGVTHGIAYKVYPAICDATGNLFCGPDSYTSTWADITAPAIKAWILQYVDPNNTGRWEGETDYPRTEFKPTGCTDKSCDPACRLQQDADCDFVDDSHDNCSGDYNPDQYNFDAASADQYQQAFANSEDPGDACDLCWRDPGPIDQPDCNKDAEFLEWGHYRQPLTELDVVGTPTNPYGTVSPLLAENRARYKGDECDNVACTSVATQWNKVPAGVVAPGPLCQGLPQNSSCGFSSNSRVQHDGRILALLSGETGGTGYRYCPCMFSDDKKVRDSCLRGNSPACPWHASEFNAATVHTLDTVSPSFATLGTSGEQGTIDTFTSNHKPQPPAFDWRWWKDYDAIQGTTTTFPLPYADISTFKLDGLLRSNVRDRPALSGDMPDLESYWHGVHLHLDEGVSADYIQTVVPSQWVFRGCPGCPWGFHIAYVLGPDPTYLPGRLFAGLPGGAVDITSTADSYVTELFGAVTTDPDLTFVSAAEDGAYLGTLDEELPTLAALDTTTLQARGFATESTDGMLGAYNALPIGIGDAPVRQADLSPCLGALGVGSAPAGVQATLSATQKALYLFAGSPDVPPAILDYDIPTGECTQLVGPVPVETGTGLDPVGQPLGLVYNGVLRSLFAVDRENPDRPVPLRVLRVGLDGSVQVLAKIASPWTGTLYLATGQDGELVVAANHTQSDHFRVLVLGVRGQKPRTLARYTGQGLLVAAPMLDERGLYLALANTAGNPRFIQLAPGDLEHPKSSPLHWVFR